MVGANKGIDRDSSGPVPGPAESEDELIEALLQRAQELWGRERLECIRPMVIQTAEHLWEISSHLPDLEDEPAFFA